jgi:voltage-gated potassium channel
MTVTIRNQFIKAVAALLAALWVGTLGFWVIEAGQATVADCLYMTVITLSTVGYAEVFPLNGTGRVFTSVLIVFGMGTLLYFGSTMTAFWVELDMRNVHRRKRMENKIRQLKDHIIVCGLGTTGIHVVRELLNAHAPSVVIEGSDDCIREAEESLQVADLQMLVIKGDATEDRFLEHAGIQRAAGLVAVLSDDKDNLY